MENWRIKFQMAERMEQQGEHERARAVYAEALGGLEQACLAEPGRADLPRILARAWRQAGQTLKALECLRDACRRTPGEPQLHSDFASLCFELEDFEGAIGAYRRLLEIDPASGQAREGVAEALLRLGRFSDAVAVLDEGLARKQNDLRLLHLKANALLATQAYDDATALFAFLHRLSQNTSAYFNLGICRIKQRRFGDAERIFDELKADPQHTVEAFYYLSLARLLAGDIPAALHGFENVLNRNPRHINSVWYRAHCWRELGRDQDAKPYLHPDNLVHRLDPLQALAPEERSAYLQTLADFARDYPYQRWEPSGKTTRGGSQTFNLLKRGDGLMLQFEQMLREAARAVLSGPVWPPTHPLITHQPDHFGVELWATILKSGGHQMPHIHPGGWISGVFYCSLPETTRNKAGWIEFGQPPYDTPVGYQPWTACIEPKPGLMVLFPSWLPHNTVPFDSRQARISLAFDLTPARA